MNREIKFRGIDLVTGKWCYGCYMPPFYEGKDPFIYIKEDRGDHWSYLSAQVIQDTVGQYTGLKDKNGIEIYEGDIMRKKPGKKYKGVVAWDKEKCRFQCEWTDGSMPSSIDIVIFNRGHVIGNVYDNPELIGREEDKL